MTFSIYPPKVKLIDNDEKSCYIMLPLNCIELFWGHSSILVRAPACHAGGCGFDPRWPRHSKPLIFIVNGLYF